MTKHFPLFIEEIVECISLLLFLQNTPVLNCPNNCFEKKREHMAVERILFQAWDCNQVERILVEEEERRKVLVRKCG